METPKQMGSDQAAPQQGSTGQQYGSTVQQQQGSHQDPVRRDGKARPPAQMQGTQFSDWASI